MKESVKPFVVLSISLLLILLQMVGAFYSKSLALFAYAGLIISDTFSLLLKLINLNDTDESFRKAQLISVILNASALFSLALIMASRTFNAITPPKIVNMPFVEIITSIVFAGLVICFLIDGQFIFTIMMSLLIITGFFSSYIKKAIFSDSYLSIFFVVLIMINSTLLIKNSFKMLKNK
jgi:Co/Zn/Cd efflux system component